MHFTLNQSIKVHVLSLQPEIAVWYAEIPEIFQSICCKATYHNSKPLVNELFEKTDFTVPFLDKAELKTLNGFKAYKKQIEWLCGRYMIKEMLRELFLKKISPAKIRIAYLPDGAPIAKQIPEICFSLSHSGRYTAVACALTPSVSIGVDVEEIGKKPDIYFLKTAFTGNEISKLEDDAGHIFKNWTIKEAYLKYIKKGFHESLHHVEVIDGHVYHDGQRQKIQTASAFFDGYVLSLVSDGYFNVA